MNKLVYLGFILFSASSFAKTWSGYYWPTYLGGIAAPYEDVLIKNDPVQEAVERAAKHSENFINEV